MNPTIHRILLGKTEEEAKAILNQFECKWRIMCRDGRNERSLSQDRDDRRYNLFIRAGRVESVIAG